MNCAEFWNEMPELGSGRHAEDEHTEHEHLQKCPQCSALFERQRRLRAGLRSLAGDLGSVGAPPRVEAFLMDAFRAEMTPAVPRPRIRWIPAFSWVAVGAAAAVLAMGVLAIPHHRASAPAAHHNAPAGIELAALTDDTADDDGFIPLPNAERVGPNDDVHVVQMELSRSAMLEVGLEVSPDQVSEPVQAEVMLGPDGLARAVRFIDPDGTY
jgi:hypothetical protein